MSLIPSQPARQLTSAEVSEANRVFAFTIDFSTVRISDALGLGGAFWVSPPAPPLSFFFLMNLGPGFFETPDPRRSSFMHELTHVWQGQHMVPFQYVLNSAAHQASSTVTTGNSSSAYSYGGPEEQKQWREYGAEEQAQIVQDWYSPHRGAQSQFDWRFRYIHSNIRTGNANADSLPVAPRFQRLTGHSTRFANTWVSRRTR